MQLTTSREEKRKLTVGIFGSNGVLGSDLCEYLSDSFLVYPINRSNYESNIGKEFDLLINANGNSKRYFANENVLTDFQMSTVSVYKSIFDFKYKKYIYISSSDIYEDHTGSQFTSEDQLINSDNLCPYGFHKYLSERIIQNHTKDYVILRSAMILGENLKKGPVYDILHHAPLFVTPDSYLQMITTEEIANIIKALLIQDSHNSIFNMGGTGAVVIKEIEVYNVGTVTFSPNAAIQRYEMNVDKLHKIYPLKTSIDYLRTYLQNYLAKKA